jgi:hypothetical protein
MNHWALLRKQSLWEARGTSQVDTRRTRGSRTHTYCLLLVILVHPLLSLVRLPNQLLLLLLLLVPT